MHQLTPMPRPFLPQHTAHMIPHPLRETLRRDPVVNALMRVSTRELSLGEYYVPANQTFLLPLRCGRVLV